MSPKVSVIVPVGNGKKYLKECLDGIFNQTLEDIEVICVDDSTTDGSFDLLRQYKSRYNNMILLSSQDASAKLADNFEPEESKPVGAGAARNLGMQYATGEYVIFLDSDDFFEENLLEVLYRNICTSSADICMCRAFNYNCETKKETKNKAITKIEFLQGEEDFSLASFPLGFFSVTTPAPWSKLYRRSFLKENNLEFQNLMNTNDLAFYIKSFSLAKKIVYLPDYLVHYRLMRPGSLQTADREKHVDNFAVALSDALRYLVENDLLPLAKISFSRLAADVILTNLKNASTYSTWERVHSTAKEIVEEIDEEFNKIDDVVSGNWRMLRDGLRGKSSSEYLWHNWRDAEKTISRLNSNLGKTRKSLADIKKSNSWRVGRLATFPIRKVRKVIKKKK